MADDLTLKPISPFYRIRFDDGASFDCTGDPEAMRAEVARLSPGDVDGYERFMKLSETTCRIGFEQLGDAPFGSWTDMLRVAPDLLRLGGYRSVYGLVSRFIKDERLRIVFSFHPLLIGGNPFTASAIYTLIPYLERRWGVHFAMGGTGQVVKGLAGLIAGSGRHAALQRRGRRRSWSRRTRHRRAAGVGRDDRGRHRGLECRFRVDLSQTAAARGAPALDRPQTGPGTLLHEPVPLVFRHRPAI